MSRTITCEECGETRWDNIPHCDCAKRLTSAQRAACRSFEDSKEYFADLAEDYYSDPVTQAEMDRFFHLGAHTK